MIRWSVFVGKSAVGNLGHHGAVVSARKLYKRAHDVEPDRSEPYVALARAQLFRGQLRDAKKELRRALALDPDNAEARRLMDGLTREIPQGDKAEAQESPT